MQIAYNRKEIESTHANGNVSSGHLAVVRILNCERLPTPNVRYLPNPASTPFLPLAQYQIFVATTTQLEIIDAQHINEYQSKPYLATYSQCNLLRMRDFIATPLLSEPQTGLGRPQRVRRFLLISNFLLIGLGIIWAGYAIYIKHTATLIADVALIALGLITLTLIRLRLITQAIHFLLVALLVWVPSMAYYISGSGVNNNGAVHYWLFVYIVGLHFVLFDAAKIVQTFYVATAILIFVVIEYNLVPLEPPYGFPEHSTLFGHGLTLGMVLIAIVFIMRTYIANLADAERRARESNIRSEQLLCSVLPPSIVDRVRSEGTTFTQRVENCTVLFADIVGFTPLATRLKAEDLVALLNAVFSRFDEITDRHGVEKIKTIGDGYMAACGLTEHYPDHAQRVARLGVDMLQVIKDFDNLSLRVGINSGPVLAGIIGQSRIAFDLWGETVNLAARMESHGRAGYIQVSKTTHDLLLGEMEFEPALTVDVKGKGATTTYIMRSAEGG